MKQKFSTSFSARLLRSVQLCALLGILLSFSSNAWGEGATGYKTLTETPSCTISGTNLQSLTSNNGYTNSNITWKLTGTSTSYRSSKLEFTISSKGATTSFTITGTVPQGYTIDKISSFKIKSRGGMSSSLTIAGTSCGSVYHATTMQEKSVTNVNNPVSFTYKNDRSTSGGCNFYLESFTIQASLTHQVLDLDALEAKISKANTYYQSLTNQSTTRATALNTAISTATSLKNNDFAFPAYIGNKNPQDVTAAVNDLDAELQLCQAYNQAYNQAVAELAALSKFTDISATAAELENATDAAQVQRIMSDLREALYPVIANGEYYIQNVSSGKFLGGAQNWNTKASLLNHAVYFTLNRNEQDGTYTFDSHVSNGGDSHYLGKNYYVDAEATPWIIIKSDNNYYITYDGSKFLGTDDNGQIDSLTDVTANAQWRLFTKQDLLDGLTSATIDNPLDATFLIADQGFARNDTRINQWNNSNCTFGPDGAEMQFNYCYEAYHKDFSMNQTLNVPNGIYRLTAQGFFRQDGSDYEHLPVFFANDKTVIFNELNGSEDNMATAANSFQNGNYASLPIVVKVTNNTLTIGARLEENANLWCIFDNFELAYLGSNAEIVVDDIVWSVTSTYVRESISATSSNGSTITYTSTNTAVINNNCQALREGHTFLTAKTTDANGLEVYSNACITVTKRPVVITWNQEYPAEINDQTANVTISNNFTITDVLKNEQLTGYVPTFTSSDDNIATIVNNSEIDLVAGGEVTITASYEDEVYSTNVTNGQTAQQDITVNNYTAPAITANNQWVNDVTSITNGGQYYIQNYKTGRWVKANNGSSLANDTVNASLWTISSASNGSIQSGSYYLNGSGTNSPTTGSSSSSTSWTWIYNPTAGDSNSATNMWAFYYASGRNKEYPWDNDGTMKVGTGVNTDNCWKLISKAQYDFYNLYAPQGSQYLYSTDYNHIQAPIRTTLANAVKAPATKTEANFDAANATIQAMIAAFDAYLEAETFFDTFEEQHKSHMTLEAAVIAEQDLEAARTALLTVRNCEDIAAARAVIREYDVITFTNAPDKSELLINDTFTPQVSLGGTGATITYDWTPANTLELVDNGTVKGLIVTNEVKLYATSTTTATHYGVRSAEPLTFAVIDKYTPEFKLNGADENDELTLQVDQSAEAEFQYTSEFGGGLSYSISDPNILSFDTETNQLTAKAAGNATITFTQTVNNTIYGGSKTFTIQVNRIPNELALTNPEDKNLHVGDKLEDILDLETKNSNATLQISYSNPNIVEYNEESNSMTALAAGSTTLTISQPQNDTYEASNQLQLTINVCKHNNTIKVEMVEGDAIEKYSESLSYGASLPIILSSDNSNPDNPVTITQTSGADVATYDAATGEIKAAFKEGTATWVVSQAEDNKYLAATSKTITITTVKPAARAPFSYDAALYNNNSVTAQKQGTQSFSGNKLTLGDASGGGFNWDDKYVILHFDGIPDKLTFEYAVCNRPWGSEPSSVEWYIQESADGNFTDNVWNGASTSESFEAQSVQLSKSTRWIKLCYSGNFGGHFRNIQISGLSYLEESQPATYNFGEASLGAENSDTEDFVINWCNIPTVSITNDNPDFFQVDVNSFADYNQYGSQTLKITYDRSRAIGEHSATITLTSGIGDDAIVRTIEVQGKTTRKQQTINWHADLISTEFNINSGSYPDEEILPYIANVANGGEVKFTSSNSDLVEVSEDGTMLQAKANGEVSITASYEGDDEYAPVEDTRVFHVTDATRQSITWEQNFLNLKTTNDPIELSASATSNGEITYTVQEGGENVVSISSNGLTIQGEGDTYITATQEGGEIDGTVYTAISMTKHVIVRNPNAQCIDFAISGQSFEFANNSNTPIVIELEGPADATINFQAYHETKSKNWGIAPTYAPLRIEQYACINNAWDWTSIFNQEVNASNARSYTASIDPSATKIRVFSNESAKHHISNLEVRRRKFVEASESSITTGANINALYSKRIEINHSGVDVLSVFADGDFTDANLSTAIIGEGCGTYGKSDLVFSFTPTIKGKTYEGNIIISDGKTTPTTITIPISITATAISQSIIDFTADPVAILTTDEVIFAGRVLSGNSVYYESSNESIAEINSDNKLVIHKAGTVTITAKCDAIDQYDAAPNINKVYTISKADPTIITNPTTTLVTLPATLNEVSLDAGVASVDGSFTWTTTNQSLTVGTHSYNVTFTPDNSEIYNEVTTSAEVTAKKGEQTIIWSDDNLAEGAEIAFGKTIILEATTSVGLSVRFTSSDEQKATINSRNEVTMVAPGEVTFTAHQDGDDNYQAAESISKTIRFLQATPNVTEIHATAIQLGQTLASSALSGNASYGEGEDAIEVSGTFSWKEPTFQPTQEGNYEAEYIFTPANQTFYTQVEGTVIVSVTTIKTAIDWSLNGETAYYKIGSNSISLDAKVVNAQNRHWISEMGVSYESSNTEVAIISDNNTIELVGGLGTTEITASFKGSEDGVYMAAEDNTYTITVYDEASLTAGFKMMYHTGDDYLKLLDANANAYTAAWSTNEEDVVLTLTPMFGLEDEKIIPNNTPVLVYSTSAGSPASTLNYTLTKTTSNKTAPSNNAFLHVGDEFNAQTYYVLSFAAESEGAAETVSFRLSDNAQGAIDNDNVLSYVLPEYKEFVGWKDAAGNPVTSIVPGADGLTLIADWKDKLFELQDGTEYTSSEDFVVAGASYTRNFNGQWQALYVPFDIPAASLEGFVIAEPTSCDGNTFSIERISENENFEGTKANGIYFIMATEEKVGSQTIAVRSEDGVIIKAAEAAYVELSAGDGGKWIFTGTYSSIKLRDWNLDWYALGSGNDAGHLIHFDTEGCNDESTVLRPERWYLQYVGPTSAAPSITIFDFYSDDSDDNLDGNLPGGTNGDESTSGTDEATSVDNLTTSDKQPVRYYNIFGMAVDPNEQGIVITSDGRKYLNR